MTEIQILKRKIRLKRQTRDMINGEIMDMQIRLALTIFKDRLEKQIAKNFDRAISHKLDAIQVLLGE